MNRVAELNRLLKSIYEQEILPKTIIIVDASDQAIKDKIDYDSRIEFIYEYVQPPGLTKQRNIGLKNTPADLTHVGFLDDDIVILPGTYKKIVDFIAKTGSDLGGVSFNIVEDRKKPNSWLLFLLGLAPLSPGAVSRAGSVFSNVNASETRFTQWLCGGATIWRTEIFQQIKFDEWYKGYAYWEDVDFSYRVGKKWKLAVVAEAKVLHLHVAAEMNELKMKRLGDLEIVDRYYFVKSHPEKMSFLAAFWASLGTIFRNMVMGIVRRDKKFIPRIFCNIEALARCSSGRVERKSF